MTDDMDIVIRFMENPKINASISYKNWESAATYATLDGHSESYIATVLSYFGASDTEIQRAMRLAHAFCLKRSAWDVIEYKTSDMSIPEAIGVALGVTIERIVKHRRGRSCHYTLVVNGAHSHTLTGAQILNYRSIQEVIFDTTGHIAPGMNHARWAMILGKLPIIEEDE